MPSDKDSNSEIEEEEDPEELQESDDMDNDDGKVDDDDDGDDDGKSAADDQTNSDENIKFEEHDEGLEPEKSAQFLTSDTCGTLDNGDGHHSSELLNSVPTSQGFGVQAKKKASLRACENVDKQKREDPSGNAAQSNNSKSLDRDKSLSNEKEVAADTLVRKDSGDKVSNIVLGSDGVRLRAPSLTTPQIRPRSPSSGAEFDKRSKKSAVICDFFAKGWCIKGSSCRFLHKKDSISDNKELSNCDVESVESSKGEQVDAGLRQTSRSHICSKSNFLGEHVENQMQHKSSQEHRQFLLAGNGPRTPFEYAGSTEHNLFSLVPPLHNNLNPDLRSQEYSRGYPLVQNNSIPGYRFLPSGSVLSSSSYGNHPFTNDNSIFGRHMAEAAAYNWEPSVPFRPSFRLPSNFYSSPVSLYDPLLDSIELPNEADRSLPSSVCQGAVIQPASQLNGVAVDEQPAGDKSEKSSSTRGVVPADTDAVDEQPPSGISEKSSSIPGIAADTTSASAAGTSTKIKSSIPNEKKPSRPGPVVSTSKAKEMGSDHNLGVNELKEKKEYKSLKAFRAALIDYVKELVKPYWLEGQLSKDVHNLIVKRAVEKVLSTFQPHQIPSGQESIDQYVSSSQTKLTKLVEGYVVKYGSVQIPEDTKSSRKV